MSSYYRVTMTSFHSTLSWKYKGHQGERLGVGTGQIPNQLSLIVTIHPSSRWRHVKIFINIIVMNSSSFVLSNLHTWDRTLILL